MNDTFLKILTAVVVTAASCFGGTSALAAPRVETVYVTGPRSCKVGLQKTEQGQIFLAVKIGGKNLDFLLDTGSPTTCLDAGVAQELGIARDTATERKIAMGGAIVSDVAAHADVTLGGLLIHSCPIHVTDMKSMHDAVRQAGFHDFQGIAGIDLLLFLRGRLEFDKLSLEIHRP